ncbi:MAG: sterol desaturase family protein [Bacteroidetes bacterium]|nr:sterol desaturase family protein [Bacteroidota bacterium]
MFRDKKLLYNRLSWVLILGFLLWLFYSLDGQSFVKLKQEASNYSFTGMLISLSILVFCFLLELVFLPFKESSIYKILHPNQSIIADLVIGIAYSLGIFFILKSILYLSLDNYFPGLFKIRSPQSVKNLTLWYFPSLIFYLLVADFFKYWFHRLSHQIEFIWQIHLFHHASTDFVILSGQRIHPIEHILNRIFVSLPLIALGIRVDMYLSVLILLLFVEKLQHSMINWDYGWIGRHIIYSPLGHRIHHSKHEEHWDKNFGDLFVFWDKLFGTYYQGDKLDIEIGLKENWMNEQGVLFDLWHSMYLAYKSFIQSWKDKNWQAIHLRDKTKTPTLK